MHLLKFTYVQVLGCLLFAITYLPGTFKRGQLQTSAHMHTHTFSVLAAHQQIIVWTKMDIQKWRWFVNGSE